MNQREIRDLIEQVVDGEVSATKAATMIAPGGDVPSDCGGQNEACIAAAEKHAESYAGDDRACIVTDVLNAFYAGAAWQAKRGSESPTNWDVEALSARVAGVPCRFCFGPGSSTGGCPDCGKPRTARGGGPKFCLSCQGTRNFYYGAGHTGDPEPCPACQPGRDG